MPISQVALSNTFNEFRQTFNNVANTLNNFTTEGSYSSESIYANALQANTLVGANATVSGTLSTSNITVSTLTSGRVVLAGTSGRVQDDDGLTYNTSTNTLTSGNLAVSGTSTLTGNVQFGTETRVFAANGTIDGTLGSAAANLYFGHVHANTSVHSGPGVAGWLTEIGSNEEKHTFIGVATSNDAIDLAIVNQNAGTLAYSEFIAMNDRGNTDSGWISMGINSSNYNDPAFFLTKKDDAYMLYEAPAGSVGTGDLVIATGAAGTSRKIIFGAGGFSTGNTQMQIEPDTRVFINIPTNSSSTTTGALVVNGGVGMTGNLNVGGNVTITGAISLQGSGNTVQTSSLSVANSLLFLAANNNADILDFGVVGEYKLGATTKYGGIVRDATDGIFKLFANNSATPANTVNFSGTGSVFAPLVIGSANVANTTAASSSTSGALTVAGGLGVAGAIYSGGYVFDGYGNLRALPPNVQSTSYTLTAADVGRFIDTSAGVTVPSGIFAVGDNVTIYNDSASTITITQGTSVTLRQAGTSNTGNRSLALRGVCTILCVASNEFVINGGGLT